MRAAGRPLPRIDRRVLILEGSRLRFDHPQASRLRGAAGHRVGSAQHRKDQIIGATILRLPPSHRLPKTRCDAMGWFAYSKIATETVADSV